MWWEGKRRFVDDEEDDDQKEVGKQNDEDRICYSARVVMLGLDRKCGLGCEHAGRALFPDSPTLLCTVRHFLDKLNDFKEANAPFSFLGLHWA